MIHIQVCMRCAKSQNPARRFCTACGSDELCVEHRSAAGTVYAVTTVHKAPDVTFQAMVPYVLVLVDLDSGGRLMGHGEADTAIGDRVRSGALDHRGHGLLRFTRDG